MPFKNDDIATYGSDLLTQYQNVVEQSAEMMAFLEQIHYKKAEIEQEKNIANIRKNITYGIINIEEGCRAAFIIILLIMIITKVMQVNGPDHTIKNIITCVISFIFGIAVLAISHNYSHEQREECEKEIEEEFQFKKNANMLKEMKHKYKRGLFYATPDNIRHMLHYTDWVKVKKDTVIMRYHKQNLTDQDGAKYVRVYLKPVKKAQRKFLHSFQNLQTTECIEEHVYKKTKKNKKKIRKIPYHTDIPVSCYRIILFPHMFHMEYWMQKKKASAKEIKNALNTLCSVIITDISYAKMIQAINENKCLPKKYITKEDIQSRFSITDNQ